MESSQFSPPLMSSTSPPHQPESSAAEAEKGSCIINQGIDLNDVGDHGGKLHGVDLNEGINFVLHEGLDLNKEAMEESSSAKKGTIDLNLDVSEECETASGKRKVHWFDLNVALTEDELDHEEEIGANERFYDAVAKQPDEHSGAAVLEESLLPSKVELPPSSGGLNIGGVSAFDILSVFTFLRSFSTLLFLSPFHLDGFVASVNSDESTLLFDSMHVSLLKTLRKHLKSLSAEGSASASRCLRSLNWDFVDMITWPVYVVEYLLVHSPGYIPGLDLHHFRLFQNDYYKMPASAKVAIMQHLCDDVIGIEAFRSELHRRTVTTEQHTRDVASASSIAEEDTEEPTDWNSDECCLCKMDGNLICCDGCPAAFHSRCVGVISSQLPAGDWYCPECAIDKDKAFKMGKSIRGAELLGTDPHGRLYYSSCGYLLVSESCGDECSFRFYNRTDLPALIEVLESSRFLYEKIISSICKHWNVISGVDRMRNEKKLPSYSVQSAFPGSRPLSGNVEVGTSGYIYAAQGTGEDGVEMENRLAGSEGSAGVSQAFTEIGTFVEGTLDSSEKNTETSDDLQLPGNVVNAGDVKVEEGKTPGCGVVSHGTHYVNFYEFARTASMVSEELTSKSSDKPGEDATRSVEKVIAGQLRAISGSFAECSWPNIQNLHVNSRKEKCGWCFYCKVPEDGMDCLLIMNDSIPAVENFTGESEVLDILSKENREKHLVDVICRVIRIENHLQGLLLGPWLNPHYSQLWRKSILEAANLASLKNMLLKLESNLHRLALSADWKKHVDSAVTMGSASHIVRRSTRVVSGLGISRKRKCSKQEITPSSSASIGLNLFWWRGGRASRKLFNWKVLPRSLASKAGRQGGFRKILGVHYTDGGNYAKRMKYTAWRAAVETSQSVQHLALQVRELDSNIRWRDIGNTDNVLKMDKETKKPKRSFKNVTIRKKCHEGEVVKYLLDFGKRRLIPKIVLRHGSKLQDSSSNRKKYWLEESHVPLHLLKAFEEKIILRTSNKVNCDEVHESSKKTISKKKGFKYLFSRMRKFGKYQCEHCKKDVLIRRAVSCQYCKGFFHKRHAQKSASSNTAESIYTCPKCEKGDFLQIDATKDQSELPKHKEPFEALKPCSGTGEKSAKEEQPVHSENSGAVPSVAPVRRHSARNVERILKLSSHSIKMTKGRRRTVGSSYWLKGVRLSRIRNDERLVHFRSKMLVLSGVETPITDKPTCSLCGELEYTSELDYVACETCKAWFHGDAMNLKIDQIRNIIGFKCHKCLNKRPPVCPLQCPTRS